MDFEIPGQQYAKQNGIWDQVLAGCMGCAGLAVMLVGVWVIGSVVSIGVATATGADEPLLIGLAWGSTLGMVVGVVVMSVLGALGGALTDRDAGAS